MTVVQEYEGWRRTLIVTDARADARIEVRKFSGSEGVVIKDENSNNRRFDFDYHDAIKVADAIYAIVGRERKGKTTTDNWEAELT